MGPRRLHPPTLAESTLSLTYIETIHRLWRMLVHMVRQSLVTGLRKRAIRGLALASTIALSAVLLMLIAPNQPAVAQECQTTNWGVSIGRVVMTGQLQSGDCIAEVAGYRSNDPLCVLDAILGGPGCNPTVRRWADIYAFTLPSRTYVQIDLENTADIDPWLRVSTAAGRELATDDNGGHGANARIAGWLDPGNYRVYATKRNTAAGNYRLTVALSPTVAACPPAELGRLTGGVGLSGQFDAGDCLASVNDSWRWADVYTFSVTERTRLHIEMTSAGPVDPYLVLLGADGNRIEADDDDGPGSAARISRTLEPGRYHIHATKTNADAGSYELSMSSASPTVAAVCSVTNVGVMQSSLNRTGQLGPGDCTSSVSGQERWTDMYALTLSEPTQLTLSMVGGRNVEPYLGLMTSGGQQLEATGCIGSERVFAQIVRTLDAGSYYVQATETASVSIGEYRLIITGRPLSQLSTAERHRELATRYAPTLHFETDEQYFPVPVETMVRYAELKTTIQGQHITLREQGTFTSDDLVMYNFEHMYLDINETDRTKTGPATVYARVYVDSFGGVAIQYWMFYLYNRTGSFGISAHEGDWEGTQIVFNNASISDLLVGDIAPDQVGFASHEGGFAGVRTGSGTATCGRFDIYVAHERHASYPQPGNGPILPWLGGDPDVSGGVLSHISRLDYDGGAADGGFDGNDRHNGGIRWGLPGAGVDVEYQLQMLSPSSPSWLNWNGYWGGMGPGESRAPRGPANTVDPKSHWSKRPTVLNFEDDWLPLQFDCGSPRQWVPITS